MTTTAPALVRGTAVFIAQCPRPDCPTQHRLTLPTRNRRPVMTTPLGLAWVTLMPSTQLRTAEPGTQDNARYLGLVALGLVCDTHGSILWLREATGHLRPNTRCDARCWQARHRVCACQCGGARHGEALDTRQA